MNFSINKKPWSKKIPAGFKDPGAAIWYRISGSFPNSSHVTHTCDPLLSVIRIAAWLKFSDVHMRSYHSWPQSKYLRSYSSCRFLTSASLPLHVSLRRQQEHRESLAAAGQLLLDAFGYQPVIYLLQIDIIFFRLLYLSTFCHLVPSAVHGKMESLF